MSVRTVTNEVWILSMEISAVCVGDQLLHVNYEWQTTCTEKSHYENSKKLKSHIAKYTRGIKSYDL